jgi:hypothetical protein
LRKQLRLRKQLAQKKVALGLVEWEREEFVLLVRASMKQIRKIKQNDQG